MGSRGLAPLQGVLKGPGATWSAKKRSRPFFFLRSNAIALVEMFFYTLN